MSQVYSTEPQTSGSVVFETTHGPLSIHLWCKECPHTVRFFLQLCLDGFYDDLVFHRIVPNFLIQTGDARYRQTRGDAGGNDNNDATAVVAPTRKPPPSGYRRKHGAGQALERRQYELNSRIRFNHRGQIAMALGVDDNGDDDDDETSSKSLGRLQPQFFVTLEEASHLDGRHVCFGGITGPSIFNALRIGQTDVYNNESNDDDQRNFQPRILSEAPRILRTKILGIDLPLTLPALAPTQDLAFLPWRIDPQAAAASKTKKRKKKNRKGVKNTNLLSFGDDMNEDDGGGGGNNDTDTDEQKTTTGIQSSHDVLTSKSLSKQKVKIKNETPRGAGESDSDYDKDKDNNTASGETKSHTQHATTDVLDPAAPPQTTTATQPSETPKSPLNIATDGDASYKPTFSSRGDRSATGETGKNSTPLESKSGTAVKKEKPQKISLVEARRAKYAKKNSNKKGNSKQERENETMARFKAFQQKINSTTTGASRSSDSYHGQILEKDFDASNDRDWMKTKFKCKKHMDIDAKAVGGDGRAVDDYVVVEERSSATNRKPGKRKRYRSG